MYYFELVTYCTVTATNSNVWSSTSLYYFVAFHSWQFTQERMKEICALGTHKKILIWKMCWIFSILMFQVIIFNNQNQLKTYKIQLQFILVLSKSRIVDSIYKLVILKFIVLQSCLIVFCLFVTKLSYMLRSVNHYTRDSL